MLFLKQLRARGFKSFADSIVLDFTHSMIGIVGPNGSGKSNITEAIRWALGEQSTKSLRGASLDDIVFSGNNHHEAVTFAEVTLVFDNAHQTFKNLAGDLIEITRRFNQKTRESEFYVNKNPVRLREIQELALETGLTRSSIAIISQGTVAQFAEAKPAERRDIFDEAAGMSQYKKRKREAQAKLAQARENYNRLSDLTSAIEKRLSNLKRQASKAELYHEKTAALKQYELAILTLDLQDAVQQLANIVEQLAARAAINRKLRKDLEHLQAESQQLFRETKKLNIRLNTLNQSFQSTIKLLAQKTTQQKELELREQYQINDRDMEAFKAQNVKRRYQNCSLELATTNQKIEAMEEALTTAHYHLTNLDQAYERQHVSADTVIRQLNQARFNYEQAQAQPRSNLHGLTPAIRAIIQHQQYLPGVVGPLLNLLTVESRYQIAVSAGISSALLSVVVQDSMAAKRAINFLKENQVGRVTFLPLETLVVNRITPTLQTFIEQQRGFIGFGNQLATINPSYNVVRDYALANLLVVDNYNHASQLARTTNYKFNIVTLSGEKFLPRGAIIGGDQRNQNLFAPSPIEENSQEQQLQQVKRLEVQEQEITEKLRTLRLEKDQSRDNFNNLQHQMEHLVSEQKRLEEELQFANQEYRLLTGMALIAEEIKIEQMPSSFQLNREISELAIKRDDLQKEINHLNNIKNQQLVCQETLSERNQEIQHQLLQLQEEITQLELQRGRLESKRDNHLQILARKYQLTLARILAMDKPQLENESEARKLIEQLTNEIDSLGSVNLEAIGEYHQEQQHFDYYQKQLQDLASSTAQIEMIIATIDGEMKQQFSQIVSEVNRVLPEVFQKLFGGGDARLIFDQPDNLLETGIEIKVNPPGKKITNLTLLSGGEKSLVALSVLFSLLRVRPLPLVILDEAEAPLDPANVERFAQYVKEFTTATQFIIVTHREGTMENCDILFGVTMQTPGITKMVKIHLLEAKSYLDLPPAI